LLLCDANMKSRMGAAIGQRLRVQKKVFAFFMKIGRITRRKLFAIHSAHLS